MSDEEEGGLGKTRIEAMSDGVFGVAMTLLLADLVTEDGLRRWLENTGPILFRYAVTLLIVGIYWVAHNNEFRLIKTTDRVALWINLLLLGCIALLPLSMATLGKAEDQLGAEARSLIASAARAEAKAPAALGAQNAVAAVEKDNDKQTQASAELANRLKTIVDHLEGREAPLDGPAAKANLKLAFELYLGNLFACGLALFLLFCHLSRKAISSGKQVFTRETHAKNLFLPIIYALIWAFAHFGWGGLVNPEHSSLWALVPAVAYLATTVLTSHEKPTKVPWLLFLLLGIASLGGAALVYLVFQSASHAGLCMLGVVCSLGASVLVYFFVKSRKQTDGWDELSAMLIKALKQARKNRLTKLRPCPSPKELALRAHIKTLGQIREHFEAGDTIRLDSAQVSFTRRPGSSWNELIEAAGAPLEGAEHRQTTGQQKAPQATARIDEATAAAGVVRAAIQAVGQLGVGTP